MKESVPPVLLLPPAVAAQNSNKIPGPSRPRTAPANGRKRGAGGETSATPGGGTRATRARVAGTPSGAATGRVPPAATPSGGRSAESSQAVPFTPRVDEAPRPLQEGENGFSANGSPIQVPGTIKQKPGPGGPRVGGVAVLTLGNGHELELGLSELEKLKAQVEAHVAAMKANVGLEQ